MLIEELEDGGRRVIIRYEDQPGRQGGLHVHAHCDSGTELTGAASVSMRYTLPDHGRRRRRRGGWTKALFSRKVGDFFNTNLSGDQEEMEL